MRSLRIPLLILAVVATEVALAVFLLDVPQSDFGAFYASGAAVLQHQPIYPAVVGQVRL